MKNAFELSEDTRIDLYHHFNEFNRFSEEEYALLESCFYTVIIEKGAYLFEAGSVPQYGGYIAKGCVRYFHITDEGVDISLDFLTEGDCASDCSSTLLNIPVSYYAQALETCELVCLNHTHFDFLSDRCPAFLKFYHAKKEMQAREQLQHYISIASKTAQERYLELLEDKPDILLRVPQYHIASYIGVHSRSFSRLKKEVYELSK